MDEENRSKASPSHPQPQPRQELEFITITNPEMARNATNRQLVRRQAMRDFHGRLDGSRRRRNEISLSIIPSPQMVARSESAVSEANQHRAYEEGIVPNPETHLDTSRVDPFFQYPVKMGYRERELCDHLYDETCIMFRTMRNVGFLNRARETAAFNQLLAMSSWHLSHLTGNHQTTEHLRYSLVATQQLQNQVNDLQESSTDYAISAVLTFVCCANLLHDLESLRIHLDGLRLMINGRGGIHTLDANPALRLILYWADINGAYLQDTSPRFPPPESLVFRTRFRYQKISSQTSFNMENIYRCCSDLKDVQDIMLARTSEGNLWNDTMFRGLYIFPILGNLLATRVEVNNDDIDAVAFEAFRLAAILYLNNLRAKFGVDTLSADPLFATKLRAHLSASLFKQDAPSRLLLWVSAVASTSQYIPEQRDWFIELFNEVLVSESIANFEELRAILVQVVWDENLLDIETNALRAFF